MNERVCHLTDEDRHTHLRKSELGECINPFCFLRVFHQTNMANRDELTQQFINTTGSTSEQAQFFLEMAGWDVKVYKKLAPSTCASLLILCLYR